MTFLLVFLALTIALGIAVVRGRTADSRDVEYSLGRIIDGPLRPAGR